MATRTAYAFFPYLITNARFRIRGIEFRSTLDTDGIPEDVREDLEILSSLFFLAGGARIKKMTCTWIDLSEDKEENDELLRRLQECHLLIGYLYSHPHPSGSVFLPYENSSFYVFRKDDELGLQGRIPASLIWEDHEHADRLDFVEATMRPSEEFIPGFVGTRNGRTHLWVAKDARIYPEIPHVILNFSQNIDINLQQMLSHAYHWALRHLYYDAQGYPSDLRKRVFVSLEWYLRSCRHCIDEHEALVHLAIALESFLRLPSDQPKKERITERLEEAVLTLLGPLPKLDIWVHCFYDARSKAVHEGEAGNTMFFPDSQNKKSKQTPGEDQSGHRSLLDYGRHVFRLCLASGLSGTSHARIVNLDARFITNQERIENICKILADEKLICERRMLGIRLLVGQLCDYEGKLDDPNRVKIASVIGAVRLAVKTIKTDTAILSKECAEFADALLMMSGPPSLELLEQLEVFADKLRSEIVWTDRTSRSEVLQIMVMLLEYATKSQFKLDFHFTQHKKKSGQIKNDPHPDT